jgi:hypothetical protein
MATAAYEVAVGETTDLSPFAVPAGAEVLGDVVTWDVEHAEVRYEHLTDALEAAGLDRGLARPVCWADAFRRGMRRLADAGTIVRKLDEAPEAIRYQVTTERRADDGSELVYTTQCLVALHKEDGSIECPDPAVLDRARDATHRVRDWRTGADISRVMFALFDGRRRADLDLIPLRKCGGTYFVRREGAGWLDAAGAFLDAVGCRLNRFPVAKGRDNRAVREAVSSRLAELVREYEGAVAEFGRDTKESTLRAAGERVAALRFKVESYAEYLGEEQAALLEAVRAAKGALAAALERVAAEKAAGA